MVKNAIIICEKASLPSQNKVADEKKQVQSGKFLTATLLLEGSRLNLSSPKRMKAGQNNKYDTYYKVTKVHIKFCAGLRISNYLHVKPTQISTLSRDVSDFVKFL